MLDQPPVTHRAFGDVDTTRKAIFDGVLKATSEKYPLENQRYKLELANVGYKEPAHFTPADQKAALMGGHTLYQPLHGEWRLTDKATNAVVDKKAGVIAHVPWMTPRGTFVYGGNEYTVANQMRLKPGVYCRVKDNGIYEAHINTKPGTGPSMRVYMEPTTGIFRLGVGQSELKLYPILKSIGVNDADLEKHWGKELLHKNMAAEDPRAVSRAFAKLVRTRADEGAEKADDATDDPEVAEEEVLNKEGEAEEVDPAWTCPLCNSKLQDLPLAKYRGHHFHFDCVAGATKAQQDRAADKLDEVAEKKADYIAAEKSDRKWSYLWHSGKLVSSGSGYVLLSVHKGLCEAAYKNLKDEGVECQAHYDNPHITVLRPNEVEELKKKHGHKWEGVAQIGQSFKFYLQKMVNLVPHTWDEVARVWFIECGSPELKKYRRDLGFPELPRSAKDDHDQRFHITVAIQRAAARKTAELLTGARAERGAIKEAALELGNDVTDAVIDSMVEEIFDRGLLKTAAQKPTEGEQLKEVFDKMELDPETTSLTLGSPHPKMTSQTILRASNKLLNISRGMEKVDDRDSLAFQNFHGPEDFFAERVKKDAGQVGRKLLWKATLRGHLKHVPSGVLTPQLNSVLLRSGMGQPLEEINPAEVYDQQHRVLRLGEGGIPCYSDDTETLTLDGWKFWPDVSITDALACRVDGRLVFERPNKLFSADFNGQLLCGNTKRISYAVTPDHRHFASTSTSGKMLYTPFSFRTAVEIHGKKAKHLVAAAPYLGGYSSDIFNLEPAPVHGENRGSATNDIVQFRFLDWVEFMACYLADGSFTYAPERKEYRTEIGKKRECNPLEYEQIKALLDRMGVTYRYEQGRRFVVSGKYIAFYLSQFGKAFEKYVPAYVMNGDLDTRRIFFDSITTMDHAGDKEDDSFLYSSASSQMLEQIGWLAVSLGKSVVYFERPRAGQNTQYQIRVSETQETVIAKQHSGTQFSKLDYTGKVYCASVPGELLFVRRNGKTMWSGNSHEAVPDESRNVQPSHFGYIDPVRAPESESMGVDSRVAHGAVKGSDGKIYTPMFNLRTKKTELVAADNAARRVVAFPGEQPKNGFVRAMVNARQIEYVPLSKVDYVIPHSSSMFNTHSNLIPMINASNAGRLLMGSKMLNQALALKNAEAPLVQTAHPEGGSFEDWLGKRMGTAHAPIDGVVTKVTKDGITVKGSDGKERQQELYDHFIFNRKTYLHNTPVVEVGAKVAKGQLLAKSNYTDKKGTASIGTNLRVGFMPYRGLNYEDAIVVSESAAKRLSSEHAYQHPLENPEQMELGRKQFISIFPGKFKPHQLTNITDNGTIKPGTVVHKGDPLILALQKNTVDAVHKGHKTMFTDGATLWDHDADGIVTDVVKTKDGGFNVVVKSYAPLQEGDKMAGRYGNKGVVSRIIPDSQMPHDSNNQHMEVLLNPLGVISRGNPAQMFETMLGKIARKRGEAYKLEAFNKENWIDFVTKEASKHGTKMTEHLVDPVSGRTVPDVLTGEMFMMKLHHTAESKGSGRDIGGYTSEEQPAKGGPEGAKRISNMEMNALLSHGATNVIRDAHLVRGQRNDDYWKLFRLGMTPPSPREPFVYKKFLSYLAGSGINLKKKGDRMQLFALTDKDVNELSSGPVRSAETVSGDKFEPVTGGLFDPGLTGGHHGNRWSHIELHEPVPNPVMEEPIRRLLGLTQKSYEKLLSGEEKLRGESGGAGIKKLLSGINIDEEIRKQEAIIDGGSVSKRDGAAKVLGYLKTMKEHGNRPEDWVLSKVPVLPPSMRPITAFNNMQLTADPNYLYRDLFMVNNDLKDLKDVAGHDAAGEERLRLYNAVKAVTGLGDPVQPKTQEKGVRGLLQHVFGSSPKMGMFQRRVLGTAADVVGRATITPNPDLSMDQVGLPEDRAWTIYRQYVIRRLVRKGMPATAAVKAVVDKAGAARDALEEEVKHRPVLINRAPTLYKYGFMAAYPVLVKGHTLQLSPVVTPGFTADFDGDAMNYHVPSTDEAISDAVNKMLPSKNLKSVKDFKVHYLPNQEFVMGLYLASHAKNDKVPPRVFASREAAISAYKRGEINASDRVVVRDEK